MPEFDSFNDIIDAFGVDALAAIIGKDESHVRTMKARDSIAPEYWPALIEAAPRTKAKGLDYRTLHALRQRRFAPPEHERARA